MLRAKHTADIDIPRGSNIRRKVNGIDKRIPGWILWEINEDFVDERRRPIDSIICAGGGRGHYVIRAFEGNVETFRDRQEGQETQKD